MNILRCVLKFDFENYFRAISFYKQKEQKNSLKNTKLNINQSTNLIKLNNYQLNSWMPVGTLYGEVGIYF